MEQLQIEVQNPATRDGGPMEVALAALDDIADLGRQAHALFDAGARQVRNAVLDQLLEGSDPSAAAQTFRDWEQGTHGRALIELGASGERIQALAETLRTALGHPGSGS